MYRKQSKIDRITICLQDSIFKDQFQQSDINQAFQDWDPILNRKNKNNEQEPQYIKRNKTLSYTQSMKNIYPISHMNQFINSKQKSPINNSQKINQLNKLNQKNRDKLNIYDYMNGSYYGYRQNNKAKGMGMFIDDEFNMFISKFNNNKINQFSFIKLLNGTTIYGDWTNGNINGWNCIEINNYSIYIQAKQIVPNQPQYHNQDKQNNKYSINYRLNQTKQNTISQTIFTKALIIDKTNMISYLVQIKKNEIRQNNYYSTKIAQGELKLKPRHTQQRYQYNKQDIDRINKNKTKTKQNIKFQIINRKSLLQHKNNQTNKKYNKQNHNKYHRKQEINRQYKIEINQIFAEQKLNIPQYLNSVQQYLDYLQQNQPSILIKDISNYKSNQIINQKSYFISISDNLNKQTNYLNDKSKNKIIKSFNPYRQQLINQKSYKTKQINKSKQIKDNKLGIIIKPKQNKTISIGTFNSNYQLNWLSVNFNTINLNSINQFNHSSNLLFGIFKSNLLVKQLVQIQSNNTQNIKNQLFNSNNQLLSIQSLKSKLIKKQISNLHLKSLNFIHQFIYFPQIQQLIKFTQSILLYVSTFQSQYNLKYSKQNSIQISQKSFQNNKYYQQHYQDPTLSNIHLSSINSNQYSHLLVKQSRFNQSNQSKRPVGKIVKSKSPLRQLNRSHSKSPSEIQTFRKGRNSPQGYNYQNHEDINYQQNYVDNHNLLSHSPYKNNNYSGNKNIKRLIISTEIGNEEKYNQRQTPRNRIYERSKQYLESQEFKKFINIKKRQIQKSKQEIDQDIVETVRERNDLINRRVSRQRGNKLEKTYINRSPYDNKKSSYSYLYRK